jgi:tetratricopeptide (TPR) repeat protein
LNTISEKNYRARVWIALIYAAMQDYDNALREASIVELANPKNGYLLYRLTNAYSELELEDQALSSLQKAIDYGFTSIQLMRREESISMKKISAHIEYKNLVRSLEEKVNHLRIKFKSNII